MKNIFFIRETVARCIKLNFPLDDGILNLIYLFIKLGGQKIAIKTFSISI